MDLSKIKKIYMIGIKGVGMTMLAQYLRELGLEVSGSDVKEKFMTDEVLKSSGIKVIEGFDEKNLDKAADLIIYSSAYNEKTNAEVAAALAGKIKTMIYAQALAEIFNQKYGLAVVGSHGKTTTTAWLGYVLNMAGLKPNVMVGARVPQFNGLSLTNSSDYLITEVDEYQNKLKYFQPRAVLLNNIDYDHPDFFPDADDYKKVFIDFIEKIPAKGFLVANFDDPIIRKIANVNCRGKVITYAINETADYIAYDIKVNNGQQYFKVKMNQQDDDGRNDYDFEQTDLGDFSIQLLGQHNISNALAVITACIELGLDLFKIRKYLAEFSGTARRMQLLGEYKGALIIDDYAHHPTEIKATLEAIKQKYGQNKIILVFHPHTYSRTKALLDDFASSFTLANELIILDIYGSAREKQGGVTSHDLVEKIQINNKKFGIRQEIKYIPSLDECEKYLREQVRRDDLVLLMGAGDVFRIGQNLIKNAL